MLLALNLILFGLLIGFRIVVTRRLVAEVLEGRQAVQWFGFIRALQRFSLTFWIVWLAASWLLDPWRDELIPAEPFGGWGGFKIAAATLAANFIVILLPALVGAWCSVLMFPAVQRLRGITVTRREFVSDNVFSQLWLPVAFALFWSGISSSAVGPEGALLPISGALWLLIAPQVWKRARGSALYIPHSVMHGPLRDRVFAMAEKAAVELKQIYVYPLEKWKLANAWASQQNTLLLTDTLLRQLSIREVDAIVAHELAHMKRRHPGKQLWFLPLFIGMPFFLFVRKLGSGESIEFPRTETVALLLIGVWHLYLLTRGWLSRRHEMQADAGGLALNGDAAGFISALGKLHRMNAMPVEFKRMEERFSTHPSTIRRFAAIARAGNIPEAEARQLAAEGLNDPERYPLPIGVAPGPGEAELIFTSVIKRKSVLAFSAVYSLVIGFPPVLGVWILFNEAGWWAFTFFLFAYAALIVWSLDWAGHRFAWQLRERLRVKLAPNVPVNETALVGLAPDRDLRVYEGVYAWDLGYLQMEAGKIRYAGEQTSFELPGQAVTAIKLVSGAPRWRRTKVVLIEWTSGDRSGAFRLSCPNSSFSRDAKMALALFERLVAWKESSNESEPTDRLPIFSPVTSAPLQMRRRKGFVSGFVMALAIPVGFMAGFAEGPDPAARVLSVIGLILLGHLFATVPSWRKPREFAERKW